jgi:hypothetical protein
VTVLEPSRQLQPDDVSRFNMMPPQLGNMETNQAERASSSSKP